MRPKAIQWCTCFNCFIWLQLEYIIIEIKNLHFIILFSLLALYQIVPDLNDVIAVVDVSINKRVLTRLKSSNQWLIGDQCFIDNFHQV